MRGRQVVEGQGARAGRRGGLRRAGTPQHPHPGRHLLPLVPSQLLQVVQDVAVVC